MCLLGIHYWATSARGDISITQPLGMCVCVCVCVWGGGGGGGGGEWVNIVDNLKPYIAICSPLVLEMHSSSSSNVLFLKIYKGYIYITCTLIFFNI